LQGVIRNSLCILFFNTKGIQWVDTDATLSTGPRKALPTINSDTEGFRMNPCDLSEVG